MNLGPSVNAAHRKEHASTLGGKKKKDTAETANVHTALCATDVPRRGRCRRSGVEADYSIPDMILGGKEGIPGPQTRLFSPWLARTDEVIEPNQVASYQGRYVTVMMADRNSTEEEDYSTLYLYTMYALVYCGK